ncbi:hypothetical protein D3C75_989250 [compost metagenome]
MLTLESQFKDLGLDLKQAFDEKLQKIKSDLKPEYFLLNDQLEDKRLLAVAPPVNEVLVKQLGIKITTKELKATIHHERNDDAAVTLEKKNEN